MNDLEYPVEKFTTQQGKILLMAILIDSSAGLYRTLHMNLPAIKENPEFLSHLVLTQILSQAEQFGASKLNPAILTLDSKSWRKEFFPEYKANRVKDESIPWEAIFTIYNDVMETMRHHSDFYVMRVERAEADDIIAVMAEYFKSKGEPVWVLSGDKDFIQIQDTPKVNLYDPLKKVFRPQQDVATWKKVHIIMGDKVDGIPAIKSGVGEKTAIKMVRELDTLLQTNLTMRENYERNEILIDFGKIPCDIKESIITEFETQEHCYNAMKLMAVFMKYKLAKHAQDLQRFKFPAHEVSTKLNSHFKAQQKDKALSDATLEDFFG
jgi:5'-3' exonuclease